MRPVAAIAGIIRSPDYALDMTAAKTPWEQDSLYCRSLDYLLGRGVPKDEHHSFALNAEAADRGQSDAVLAMGWFSINGLGVERDLERARKWYWDSARRGEIRAMFSLGQIDYEERDYSEALSWFRRTSDAGHHRSFYFIGRHYWRGHGVEQDKKEAMTYFHRAASHKVEEAQRVLRLLT
jgi:TPR repeat protein